MIVTCQHCGKKLRVDLSMIQGDRAKVRCRHCRQLFTVTRPTGEEASAKGAETEEAPGGPEKEPEEEQTEGWSLGSKLVAIMALLMFGALSVTGLVGAYFSQRMLASQAEGHLRRLAEGKSGHYSAIFDRVRDEVQGMADYVGRLYARNEARRDLGVSVLLPWDGDGYGNPRLRRRFRSERLLMQRAGEALQSLASKNPFLSLGYYGSANDLLVLNDASALERIRELDGFAPTERPWYVKAREKGGVAWSDPYVDANSKDLVVTCAAPVTASGGELLGVVGFDVPLKTIERDMLNMDTGYDSYAFLVDREGEVLVKPGMVAEGVSWRDRYATDDLLRTDNPGFSAMVRDMVRGESGFVTFTTDGRKMYAAYSFLPSIRASMAIVTPGEEVMEPIARMRNTLLAIWGLVLLVTIWISLYVGRWITRPINHLTHVANLISQGKTDLEELPEERRDEIGLLTRSFNRLINSLRVALKRR